jgi:N5-(cytidine 5'-diphosphoramidyl)-L-glutamine hydrolase
MSFVAISQRVVFDTRSSERRDCLDQAWIRFVKACGLVPIVVPNDADAARSLCCSLPLAGILLTGGNDLSDYGGDAPERDIAEASLIEIADAQSLPLLGVCRGMQMIQHRLGIRLDYVRGHVAERQIISVEGMPTAVNSYHQFGTTLTLWPLEAWATADDGVVKAVRHENGRVAGIMWHPERFRPFEPRDILFFRRFFGAL